VDVLPWDRIATDKAGEECAVTDLKFGIFIQEI
jgi:hypothetical protein